MTKRRSRGDGSLHWHEKRQRWIAVATVGWTPAGKRIVKSASGKTKTEAKNKLKEILRDYDDGLAIAPHDYTVEKAVRDWLTYGLSGRDKQTVTTVTILANTHVIPSLGARKLRELSAEDVDKWLADKAKTLATRSLRDVRSVLKRAIARAQARDKVKRNVVLLCDVPVGQRPGRPSKALTFDQAEAVLKEAEADDSTLGSYIVVSLLTGARTEEARPLYWEHVDLVGQPDETPPVLPHIDVWRSVRAGGDTKTRKSRRSLALAQRAVNALQAQKIRQAVQREQAGSKWQDNNVVFASEVGTELDSANVRRGVRRILKAAGLKADEWTPRELRHSFVSLLSDRGVPIEKIALLVGHSSTSVTEQVYRHQLRPVIEDGAVAMNDIFPGSEP
ncbi:integrase [Kibdelosporangium banguiense]|uniref:Integrase n=1 Tax=Kibdelosporangium banguiense TaxID=1365924 RepID=A0ABS4TAP2_9PSEU|nr:site-specific integrase [Kibdelosporangium banguiense]MBP2321478.1 integrase [Kibdelosporangium banguiense]